MNREWSADCDKRSHFFFNDTATTEIYTLSLHDALPILRVVFVQGEKQLAYLALEPISAVLSLMLSFLGQDGFFEIFFNFALPFLLFGFVFMILALFLWVRWASS